MEGVVAVAGLLALWAVAAVIADQPRILPTPWAVGAEIVRLAGTGELWRHMSATFGRVVASFVLALIAGTGIGVLMGRRAGADRWLNPLLVIALNMPALVVIVLCYIWIGLNETAAVTAVALNKVPLVAVMIRDGTRALSPALDDMAQAFRLPLADRWRHVILPQLVPHLASAARAGISLIWKIVLVVEFLGRSTGVGFKLHMSFSLFDVTGVLAWALGFVVLMLAIDGLVLRPWERRASRWRRDAA
ncbi:ABC transporter permease subunit [Paracoccus sp. S-4012]|nr:ABC transporter permease [Paracoccus sp. S-4012]MRX51551.1 ABC transporter permease subunit [Paracoccus sp. S-4012]